MKKHQFTLNWYHLWIENPSQWTILEPLCYSSFVFTTLDHGVIGYKFCWLLPQSRSTSWTWISWYTNWAWSRIDWNHNPIVLLEGLIWKPWMNGTSSLGQKLKESGHRSGWVKSLKNLVFKFSHPYSFILNEIVSTLFLLYIGI